MDNLWRFLTLTSNWSLALNLSADRSTPALAILWTVAVEFQFYAIATALAGVTAACLLAWIAANGSSSIVRFLSSGPLTTCGILSYGIYLWHPMGGDIYGALLTWQPSPMFGINIRSALSLVLYFGCAFMLAAISYVIVERPAIALGRRLLRQQRLSPSPAL